MSWSVTIPERTWNAEEQRAAACTQERLQRELDLAILPDYARADLATLPLVERDFRLGKEIALLMARSSGYRRFTISMNGHQHSRGTAPSAFSVAINELPEEEA